MANLPGPFPAAANRNLAATLGVTVVHVLAVGAEPKVRRVHAGRVVTGMEDMEAGEDGTVLELPRETVSGCSSDRPTEVQPPIAILVARPDPLPATRLPLGDASPEALEERDGTGLLDQRRALFIRVEVGRGPHGATKDKSVTNMGSQLDHPTP